jgi:hypothetical protein
LENKLKWLDSAHDEWFQENREGCASWSHEQNAKLAHTQAFILVYMIQDRDKHSGHRSGWGYYMIKHWESIPFQWEFFAGYIVLWIVIWEDMRDSTQNIG